ncbi:hypothetical protein ABGF26_02640 [Helcococcus ovis]|uniref:phage head-tail connector protein n=1 Tax=Helcococcus ovis TaxID=72026 RepID=UPI0038BCEB66
MLKKIKKNLRIYHDELDEDITGDIEACKLDLKRVGINPDVQDDLIEKAIKLYCRWQFNFENQADRYANAYRMLRDSISLCLDYKKKEDI